MVSYIVIGICIILLLLVVYISAKPISMGIEARRNINVSDSNDDTHHDVEVSDIKDSNNLSDEILKLEELNKKGILTDEEYEKAKKKLLDQADLIFFAINFGTSSFLSITSSFFPLG